MKVWWNNQDLGIRVGILVLLGILSYFMLSSWKIYVDQRRVEADGRLELMSAQIENQVAQVKLNTVSIQSEIAEKLSTTRKPNTTGVLPVVVGEVFDCSTKESYSLGFAKNPPLEMSKGTQVLVKNGCAWLKIEHRVSSLSGSGYVLTFDPVSDPQPNMCGNGQGGRSDSPANCLEFVNTHLGENVRVIVNGDVSSFLKIGG